MIFIVHRAYETLSDDNKRKIYEATGMDSNEQRQTGAGPSSGFGFNPFGQDFWSQFGGGAKAEKGSQSYDDLFKEFEQFFSMGGEGSKQ